MEPLPLHLEGSVGQVEAVSNVAVAVPHNDRMGDDNLHAPRRAWFNILYGEGRS